MDISFKTENGKFNFRVCAIITRENKLLCMKDNRSPYYYLPGGRVQLHENTDEAVLREVKEELDVDATIVRPLWFMQSFFNEDVSKVDYHELCMYYLVDVSQTKIAQTPEKFPGIETEKGIVFEWLPFDTVKNAYLYPLFIKERICNLPEALEMIKEYQ